MFLKFKQKNKDNKKSINQIWEEGFNPGVIG